MSTKKSSIGLFQTNVRTKTKKPSFRPIIKKGKPYIDFPSIDKEKVNSSFVKAKKHALALLKIRDRSEFEIRDRLRLKRFSKPDIEQTVKYLTGIYLLDDNRFARDWIKSRLAKPFGIKRISFELRQKGIDPKIIQDAYERLRPSFLEDDIVLSLAKRQIQRYSKCDELKKKQRLFGFLSRRGFSLDSIRQALKKI